jgi:hypothetical protein
VYAAALGALGALLLASPGFCADGNASALMPIVIVIMIMLLCYIVNVVRGIGVNICISPPLTGFY